MIPKKHVLFCWIILLSLFFLISACTKSASPVAPQTEIAPSPALVIDDFEAAQTSWKPGQPPNYNDSSASSTKLSGEPVFTEYTGQGKQSLELAFKSDLPKAIFVLERPIDLTRARYLEFDLLNPGNASGVAIAICTGPDWSWHESLTVSLEKGFQTVSFDLEASAFKTSASGWQNNVKVAALNNTQRIAIIIFPTSPGSVFMDNLRLNDSAYGKLPDAAALAPISTPFQPKEATYLKLKALEATNQAYEKIELEIETDGVYANPFDPAQVDLRLRFTSPQGESFLAPAFWFQDYDLSTGQAQGKPSWRARFTPTVSGQWTAQAVLASPPIASQEITLEVGAAQNTRGFVRLHPNNPRYLAFEDGATFFPIGINMGWGGSAPLEDYRRWLDQLQANGGNIIRVWMASWSFGIEWNDTGLGDYTRRLDRAWQLDQLFHMAEERSIYIELVLLNHGAFSESVNPEWSGNPYNAANGGPCKKPECFAIDPTARQFFKQRLRYIAARWGYSTALMAWEWWNEEDWTPIDIPHLATWIQEMTPVLKEHDPYSHLISTSFARSSAAKINNLSEIDFAQVHLYDSTDPVIGFPDLYEDWSGDIPGKALMFAEFGASAGGENDKSDDRQGLHLHNGLWASTFSGYASTAMYWWWDSYIDPLNLWGVYKRLSVFLEGEDLATLDAIRVAASNRNVPVLALGNDQHLLLFIHDRKYDSASLSWKVNMMVLQGKERTPDWIYLPDDPISELKLKFTTLQDGDYELQWYSPNEGRWLEKTTLQVSGGEGSCTAPAFQGDLAAKVERR